MLDNESGWDVTLMTWDDFKSALQFGSGESWDTLRHVDLVLGGVDLSSDFMWVKPFTPVDHIDTLESGPHVSDLNSPGILFWRT